MRYPAPATLTCSTPATGKKREIEPRAVEDYLAYGYVPEPCTIFRQALKLANVNAPTSFRI